VPGSRWQERQGQRVARRGGRGARQVQLDQRGQGRDARRDGAIDGIADQRELLQLLRAHAARPWAQPYIMHTLTSALNEREGGGPLLAPGLQEQSSNAGSSLLRTCFWCVQAALPLVSKQFNHFVRTASAWGTVTLVWSSRVIVKHSAPQLSWTKHAPWCW